MTPAETCPHTERTAHFEWKCTLPAGHGGTGHFLGMHRRLDDEDAAS